MERDPVSMLVADNIKALMTARGMDAASLARAAGLNPTGIYDILSGKSQSPKVATIAKIANGLDVPLPIIFETSTDVELRDNIIAVYESLSEQKKDLLLKTARAWVQESA